MSQFIAEFEKVSFEQWCNQFRTFNKETKELDPPTEAEIPKLKEFYDDLKMPERATIGSAGYDFFTPYDMEPLMAWNTTVIPTGWKCKIQEGWALILYAKSSLASRYETLIDGGAQVIDADYYNNPNDEGHIVISLKNGLYPMPVPDRITNSLRPNPKQFLFLKKHQPFCQGVFMPFGLAKEVTPTNIRKGGFGSTYDPGEKEEKPAESKPKSSLILP